jgi:lipopolysaccharide export system ATP-binding protein
VFKLKHRNIGVLITDHDVNSTRSIVDQHLLFRDAKHNETRYRRADDETVRRVCLNRFELSRR